MGHRHLPCADAPAPPGRRSVFLSASREDGGHITAAERVGGEDHSPIFRAAAGLGEVEVQTENRKETLLTHTRTDVEETAVRFLLVALEFATMARAVAAFHARASAASSALLIERKEKRAHSRNS